MLNQDRPVQRLDLVSRFPYARKEYAARVLWEIARSTLWRIGTRRAFRWRRTLLRSFGAELADSVVIRPNVEIQHPWLLKIGLYSCVGDRATIYNLGPVSIGDHTVLSQRVHVCAGTHDHRRFDLPLVRASVSIGSGVWIAAEAFIGPDVTIGNNCLVGARAVVTKHIPPNSIVVGNPARIIGRRYSNIQ